MELNEAAAVWLQVCRHPWIQFCYLFFVLAGSLTILSVLPQIIYEVAPHRSGRLLKQKDGSKKEPDLNSDASTSEEAKQSMWLGKATDHMFRLLRVSGELLHRYLAIGAPLVFLHYWLRPADTNVEVHHYNPIWSCYVLGIVSVLVFWVTIRAFRKRMGGNQQFSLTEDVLGFFLSCIILAGCMLLPYYAPVINITWAFAFSALCVLVGSAKLFEPVLCVALDVLNWLRKEPKSSKPA